MKLFFQYSILLALSMQSMAFASEGKTEQAANSDSISMVTTCESAPPKLVLGLSHFDAPNVHLHFFTSTNLGFERKSGAIKLRSGDMLVEAQKDTLVKVNSCDVAIPRNTIALLSNRDGRTTVYNLYEQKANTIEVQIAGSMINLAA